MRWEYRCCSHSCGRGRSDANCRICSPTCASSLHSPSGSESPGRSGSSIGGGVIRYQPTSASAAARRGFIRRRFIDIELADKRATNKSCPREVEGASPCWTTVVIPQCHNIQHDRLTDSHQPAHLTGSNTHQNAPTIRSHLHCRPSSGHLRGPPTLSFTPTPPNGRDGREGKCQQKFPDRHFFTSEHRFLSASEPIGERGIACYNASRIHCRTNREP